MKKTDTVTVKCVFKEEGNLQEILLHSFNIFINNKIKNMDIIEKTDEKSVNEQ